jgi:hypothetical protein
MLGPGITRSARKGEILGPKKALRAGDEDGCSFLEALLVPLGQRWPLITGG